MTSHSAATLEVVNPRTLDETPADELHKELKERSQRNRRRRPLGVNGGRCAPPARVDRRVSAGESARVV